MAIRRESVVLEFDTTGFTAGIGRAKEVARAMGAQMVHDAATWEPIDWSDFD